MKNEKFNFNIKELLSRDEMKTVVGGSGSGTCDSDQFSCTCNGTYYGCVSSIQECWNKC